MDKPNQIMIVAGEVSGDMHGASLVREIHRQRPDISFFGIGGELMRAEGVQTSYDIADMAVTGIWEVLRNYRFLTSVFRNLIGQVKSRKPDVVVLVDYPGFNLRLAAKLRAMRVRTVQYICPQVWAWNKARIPRMARILDRLITIFPFEAELFASTELTVDFAGHPLVDEARETLDSPAPELPWKDDLHIALLPGSRENEINYLLPPLWEAAALIEKVHPDASFVIPAPTAHAEELLRGKVSNLSTGPSKWAIVQGKARHVLRQSKAALVASGTATLEASLMCCPMVIVYIGSPITAIIARLVVTVSHLGLVNIIADRDLCPELLQKDCKPQALADALEPLLSDTPARQTMLQGMDKVNHALGEGGAAKRAAQSVLAELERA